MKNITKVCLISICIFLFSNSKLIAQAPLGFNYQGVALTNAGTPVASKKISLRISLLESQQLGNIIYQETHGVNTDNYGQFSVIIGNGQIVKGKMSDIQWSKFPYYLKVELDIDGGSSFAFVGTSQLLSVPYALYANNAGAASISVDSVKNELATIKLSQKGDSIILSNNRGAVYIPKVDSLSKVVNQLASIKAGSIKYIKDSISKLPNGIAIGYNALINFDSTAFNSSNVALGQNAGGALTKTTNGSSNTDNILIGQNTAASINASNTISGAYQNIMIGNGAGQTTNPLASQNIVIGHEAAKNSNGTIGTKTSVFNNNIAIGSRSLKSAIISQSNVSIGVDNLNVSTQVNRNIMIGSNSVTKYNGDDNVIIGAEMLTDTSSNGSKNVIIGSIVAKNLRGSKNVIIGYRAAYDSTYLNTNNKLIIANDSTRTPLIFGDFENKKLTINGDLTVSGKFNLTSATDSTIKALNNRIDSLVNIISKVPSRIDSSTLFKISPAIATKFLDSVFLPSINFDGSKSYVLIGKTNLYSFPGSYTVEGWIKNQGSTGNFQRILGNGSFGSYEGNRQAYAMGINNNRLYVVAGTNLNNTNYNISTDYPSDSLWHHVANVFDYKNKVNIIYIDGIEKIRQTANFIPQFEFISAGDALGANYYDGLSLPNGYFKGSMRKLRVSKGPVYSSNFTPSYTYNKTDSTIAFWELNDLGTHIKANDSAYNGTLYNGSWLVPDTSSVRLSYGLVAYYPFSGNANDSSGNSLNGIVTGAVLTNDRFGNANKAYKFSGNSISNNTIVTKDDFIQVSNFNKNFNDKISISLWANVDSTNYGAFLQRRIDNNVDFAISSYGGTSGNSPDPNIMGWYIGGSRTNLGKTIIPYKTWHNYIYVYDGITMKSYLDGVLEAQTNATGVITNNSTDLLIGKYIYHGGNTHHFYYNGAIDDIRIYDRVLNSKEINALSTENGAPANLKTGDIYGGGLVAYIYQPTDSGYVSGQVHGIIAANVDQGTASWGCEGTLIGTTNGLGRGKFNTEQIIAKCSDTATAAKVCRALTLNGYSDWYFPSLDEMKQLRLNLHLKGLGNFRTDLSYFASTETTATAAYEFYISSAAAGGINKQGNKMAVRAIRYF